MHIPRALGNLRPSYVDCNLVRSLRLWAALVAINVAAGHFNSER